MPNRSIAADAKITESINPLKEISSILKGGLEKQRIDEMIAELESKGINWEEFKSVQDVFKSKLDDGDKKRLTRVIRYKKSKNNR